MQSCPKALSLQSTRKKAKGQEDAFWKLMVPKRFPKPLWILLYVIEASPQLVGDQNLVNLPLGDFLRKNAVRSFILFFFFFFF